MERHAYLAASAADHYLSMSSADGVEAGNSQIKATAICFPRFPHLYEQREPSAIISF